MLTYAYLFYSVMYENSADPDQLINHKIPEFSVTRMKKLNNKNLRLNHCQPAGQLTCNPVQTADPKIW